MRGSLVAFSNEAEESIFNVQMVDANLISVQPCQFYAFNAEGMFRFQVLKVRG